MFLYILDPNTANFWLEIRQNHLTQIRQIFDLKLDKSIFDQRQKFYLTALDWQDQDLLQELFFQKSKLSLVLYSIFLKIRIFQHFKIKFQFYFWI